MKDADKELLDDLATLNHYQKIKIEVYEEILEKIGLLPLAQKMYLDRKETSYEKSTIN